jgi:hypothetical protein
VGLVETVSAEVAIFVGETTYKAIRWLAKRKKDVEILVMDMFYKPKVLRPAHWEFDEETFENGMPVKVINNSSSKHFTISFFRFHTEYLEGKKTVLLDHDRISLGKKAVRNLEPNKALELSLPWKTVGLSAMQSRLFEIKTGIKDHQFTLNFHDDYTNAEYSSAPLYPFRLASEANHVLNMW